MKRFDSKLRFALLLGLLALFLSAVYSFAGQNDTHGSNAASAQQAADSSEYVGVDTCKTCHEDMPAKGFFQRYEDSPHFQTTLDTKKGPEWHGCEACHGPGKAHVEGGGDKTKIFSFKMRRQKKLMLAA